MTLEELQFHYIPASWVKRTRIEFKNRERLSAYVNKNMTVDLEVAFVERIRKSDSVCIGCLARFVSKR